MNCPNCGAQTKADQQYCRECGAGLTDSPPRRFNVRAWGMVALMLIFSGMLLAMGGKMWAVKWLIFTGITITFAGMFGIAAYGLLHETRSSKAKRIRTPPSQPEILRADTTNKLL